MISLKNPRKIIKDLYLGSWATAVRRATLKRVGMTHIINCAYVNSLTYEDVIVTNYFK
jgi:hypothetical protein